MYKSGHRGVALLLMAPLTALFGPIGLFMSMVAVAVCRLPDIDHDYSWLPHRGPTHTIWSTIGVAVLVIAGGYAGLSMLPIDLPVLPLAVLLGATAFLGLISHLFADALTVGGGCSRDSTVPPPVSVPAPVRTRSGGLPARQFPPAHQWGAVSEYGIYDLYRRGDWANGMRETSTKF